MTMKEIGSTDLVLESLAHCFSRSPGEIKVWTFISHDIKFKCSSFLLPLIKPGHSVSFGPAVSHLLCAGFTEI